VKVDGGTSPHSVADRSGAPGGEQGDGPVGTLRAARILGIAALVGWALVAATGGGIDVGDGLPGGGPTGAFLALALGAPLAAAAAALAWRTAGLRAAPTLLALAATGGIVAWSALSIVWAAGPDLAWIDANRTAIGLCALILGVGLGALIPRAPRAFGLGITVAAALPLGLALATKVFPSVFGADRDLARLADPVGYWNGLSLLAVLAMPGLLWLAAAPVDDRPRWGLPVAGAGLAAIATVVVLTYSRGGIFAAALAIAVALAILPGTGRGLAAVAAGIAGAALPASYALTNAALSSDNVPVSLREGPGLGLGWRLVVGAAVGAGLAVALPWLLGRVGAHIDPRRRRHIGIAAVVVVAAGLIIAVSATPSGRDWTGDRWSEIRGEGGDAVANDASRLVDASGNQRAAWWTQGWRGFTDSPVIGQGAGGFRLVHLQERRNDNDRLLTNEPHGVVVRFLSGTGIVGLLLFATLVGAVVWGVLRSMVRHPRPETALPLAMLAAFAMQMSVDWAWAIPAVTIPAFAAAGVVLASAAPGRVPGARRPGGPAVAGVAALALVAVVSALLPWWSVRLTDQADAALADGRPRAALEHADAAHQRNPLALGPLRVKAAAYTTLGQRARAYGVYLEMTRLQPDNPATWRALARFYDNDPRATDAWRRVLVLSPRDGDAAAEIGG